MSIPDPRDELLEHLPQLRAYARSLTRNAARADDLVQDSLLKAWANIEKFQPGSNMRGWLFTILRNTFYSERRKAAREVEDVDGAYTASLSEKPAHDGRLAFRDFAVAFDKLTEDQREVLILVGGSGFSYEEAAEVCGVAIGTIKSRANRGRARLAELLGSEAGGRLDMTDPSTLAVLSTTKTAAA